jgi:hypothetical protein
MGETHTVTAIVSFNGLGHLRRVTAVLDRVSALVDARIALVCNKSHWNRLTGSWPVAARLAEHAEATHAEVGPLWSTDPKQIGHSLADWPDSIARLATEHPADLVISDNLAGVLQVRPDAVLMGSFLWSDVLSRPDLLALPQIAAFIEHERALLADHRPPMLCVADVAMPGVLAHTAAVPVPLMCPPHKEFVHSDRGTPPVVGVAIGGTAAIVEIVDPLVQRLAQRDGINLAVDPPLATRAPKAGLLFRDVQLKDLDLLVCRPGMGTLTDCVGLRLPMITVREHGNAEMDHLAARMKQLVGAPSVDLTDDGDSLVPLVRDVLEPGRHAAMRAAYTTLRTDGIEAAADWILRRLMAG